VDHATTRLVSFPMPNFESLQSCSARLLPLGDCTRPANGVAEPDLDASYVAEAKLAVTPN
jgi:hypothetical protein